jgi:hypothetical protein
LGAPELWESFLTTHSTRLITRFADVATPQRISSINDIFSYIVLNTLVKPLKDVTESYDVAFQDLVQALPPGKYKSTFQVAGEMVYAEWDINRYSSSCMITSQSPHSNERSSPNPRILGEVSTSVLVQHEQTQAKVSHIFSTPEQPTTIHSFVIWRTLDNGHVVQLASATEAEYMQKMRHTPHFNMTISVGDDTVIVPVPIPPSREVLISALSPIVHRTGTIHPAYQEIQDSLSTFARDASLKIGEFPPELEPQIDKLKFKLGLPPTALAEDVRQAYQALAFSKIDAARFGYLAAISGADTDFQGEIGVQIITMFAQFILAFFIADDKTESKTTTSSAYAGNQILKEILEGKKLFDDPDSVTGIPEKLFGTAQEKRTDTRFVVMERVVADIQRFMERNLEPSEIDRMAPFLAAFRRDMDDQFRGTISEVFFKSKSSIPTPTQYNQLRRLSIGLIPCISYIEVLLRVKNKNFEHYPEFSSKMKPYLEVLADLTAQANDGPSLNKELPADHTLTLSTRISKLPEKTIQTLPSNNGIIVESYHNKKTIRESIFTLLRDADGSLELAIYMLNEIMNTGSLHPLCASILMFALNLAWGSLPWTEVSGRYRQGGIPMETDQWLTAVQLSPTGPVDPDKPSPISRHATGSDDIYTIQLTQLDLIFEGKTTKLVAVKN